MSKKKIKSNILKNCLSIKTDIILFYIFAKILIQTIYKMLG